MNERTNGNFNVRVTTDTPSSANSCGYKQWTDSMNERNEGFKGNASQRGVECG